MTLTKQLWLAVAAIMGRPVPPHKTTLDLNYVGEDNSEHRPAVPDLSVPNLVR